MNNLYLTNMSISLSNYVLDFIDGRNWDQAGCKAEIGNDYGAIKQPWFTSEGALYQQTNVTVTGEHKWGNSAICNAAIDAVQQFVANHNQIDGHRIWGLTYTLYPNGKFNIEYDYTKPAWYQEEQSEPVSLDSAMAGLMALGVKVDVDTTEAGDNEVAFLSQALARLQAQTADHENTWGLGHEAQWNLDLNCGRLRFTFEDGRVMEAGVQVVGTYNTQDGTFLWGWDHPSVPEPLRRAAERVRDYGKDRGIERFTTRQIACTEAEAWEFTAAAAQLDEAAGAYRGNANGTWVYMVFDEPKSI